ncbi:MAG TPA: TauD/TfdA family dioxygenase [Trebonia sp.]|jgi:taurine dioxygenase|nr:TauD/TfdA family dioxygenase [Trebonia sp.]
MEKAYTAIKVEPLTHVIGAEIDGVDLSSPLSDTAVEEIKRAAAEYCVVFFRGQSVDINQYEAFGKQLGPVYTQSLGFGAIDPRTDGITVLDAPAFKGRGEGWHVDELWTDTPPSLAMLRAAELPGEGGDTSWSSMYAAYEELSKPMQDFLEPLTGEYTADVVGKSAIRRIQLLDGDDSPEANMKRERFKKVLAKAEAMVPVHHPLVKVHPVTGRKHLYFSRNAIQRVVGLTGTESEALLEFLFRHVEAMQFQYRNHWELGKIALWDERCAQHAVVPDYEGRRLIWRCYMAADNAA